MRIQNGVVRNWGSRPVNRLGHCSFSIRFPFIGESSGGTLIDIRKLERPHRSGVLAIAVAYALMYVAVDFTNLGNVGQGTLKDLVACHLLPMLCIDLHREEVRRIPPPPNMYQALLYCPECRVRKHKPTPCVERIGYDIEEARAHFQVDCPDSQSAEEYVDKHWNSFNWEINWPTFGFRYRKD
jgi:hypothetical protein